MVTTNIKTNTVQELIEFLISMPLDKRIRFMANNIHELTLSEVHENKDTIDIIYRIKRS